MLENDWYFNKPRKVNVIVDNDSWIIPYAKELVRSISSNGDHANFISNYSDVLDSDISFYLGCIRIAQPSILVKSRKNLVVHASDLPQGRGFSPLTWQILEGKNNISVCLLEMSEEVDSGDVVYRDCLAFDGCELLEEMRLELGNKTIELCSRYISENALPIGNPQEGKVTHFTRRKRCDSELDIHLSIDKQFNLLRVVDNVKYPAFFVRNGVTYHIEIHKGKLDESI